MKIRLLRDSDWRLYMVVNGQYIGCRDDSEYDSVRSVAMLLANTIVATGVDRESIEIYDCREATDLDTDDDAEYLEACLQSDPELSQFEFRDCTHWIEIYATANSSSTPE